MRRAVESGLPDRAESTIYIAAGEDMPQQESDKVHREIEELLDRLDNFVPEERFVSKFRSRRTAPGGTLFKRLLARVTGITLGQVLLAGLALLLVATFLRGPLGGTSTWLMVANCGNCEK